MTHGALTEPSLNDHIGKGREGKGRGTCVAHASLTLTSAAPRPVDNSQQQPSTTMHALDLSGVVL